MPYFDPTVDTALAPMLERLEHWLKVGPERISRQNLADLAFKPAPGKWSKKEILGHLIDSAINNLQRFSQAVFADRTYKLFPYPQDDLVRIKDYQNQPLSELLGAWSSLNYQILQFCKKLDSTQLEIPILFPNGETEKFAMANF